MREPMLIDRWMPEFNAVERHSTVIRASPGRVYRVGRALDLRASPLVRALFLLRSLPALFVLRERRGGEKALGATLGGLLENGFVLLGETEGEEFLLGLVGRFWTPSGGIVRVTPEEFAAFRHPGYATATWNFTLQPAGDGAVRLSTETRVRCTDEASRRRFLHYWRIVGPFSALIRREMLRVIRRAAERDEETAARGP